MTFNHSLRRFFSNSAGYVQEKAGQGRDKQGHRSGLTLNAGFTRSPERSEPPAVLNVVIQKKKKKKREGGIRVTFLPS